MASLTKLPLFASHAVPALPLRAASVQPPAAGFLPPQWGTGGKMFPRLQSLRIHSNNLWAATPTLYATQAPWLSLSTIRSALPGSWTSSRVPRSFPQLQSLVLYPGNTELCSLPDPLASGGHAEINGGRQRNPVVAPHREQGQLQQGVIPGHRCSLAAAPAVAAEAMGVAWHSSV